MEFTATLNHPESVSTSSTAHILLAQDLWELVSQNVADYAIFSTDTLRRITSWNAGAQAIFGYTEAQLIGQSADKLFTTEDCQQCVPEREARAVFRTGRVESERWYQRQDGTQFIGSATITPLRDQTGHTTGLIQIVRDLTAGKQAEDNQCRSEATIERIRAEESLRRSEEQFRSLVIAGSDTLYQMNADWSEMNTLKGFDFLADTEIANANWMANYIPVEDQPHVQAVICQAIRAKGIFELEHRVILRDHSVGWAFSRAVPTLDAQGAITEWFGVASDVTERKRAEEALRQSEGKYRCLSTVLEEQVRQRTAELQLLVGSLQRSNADLEQFAYIASHDLQEPLRKIQSFGDLLMMLHADELGEGVGYLNRMQTAASRMSALVDDLLAFSRIATRQETSAPVALTNVVDKALVDLDEIIRDVGAQIQLDPLPTVTGDTLQLTQLFQHLLDNSLKFQQPGVPPVVRISSRRVAATLLPPARQPTRLAQIYDCIDVTDNGIGFDEKNADRIFQVFQRLHGKNQYAGTGIGLAICKKIVINHGGFITATSQPGQGATFSIYLPI